MIIPITLKPWHYNGHRKCPNDKCVVCHLGRYRLHFDIDSISHYFQIHTESNSNSDLGSDIVLMGMVSEGLVHSIML